MGGEFSSTEFTGHIRNITRERLLWMRCSLEEITIHFPFFFHHSHYMHRIAALKGSIKTKTFFDIPNVFVIRQYLFLNFLKV